jgi:hypothetical protein
VILSTSVRYSAEILACILATKRDSNPLEQISDLSGLATTDPDPMMAIGACIFSLANTEPPVEAGRFGYEDNPVG